MLSSRQNFPLLFGSQCILLTISQNCSFSSFLFLYITSRLRGWTTILRSSCLTHVFVFKRILTLTISRRKMAIRNKYIDIKRTFFQNQIFFEPLTSFDLGDLASPVDFFLIFIRLFIFIRIVVKFHFHSYFPAQNIMYF